MSDSRKTDFDVIIAGAGPAGASTAIRLANSGLSVLLVEKAIFPREKLCGEFISPECLTHFKELNVLDKMSSSGAVEIGRTVFYARNGRSAEVPSEWFAQNTHALGLSRAEMDNILLAEAASSGVEVMEGTSAVGLLTDGSGRIDGIVVKTADNARREIRSQLTIDATGRSAVLARHVNKDVKPQKAGFVAFKAHLAFFFNDTATTEIYTYRGGYGGLNRVENDRYNLCFIVSAANAKQYRSDADAIMKGVLMANQRAAAALTNARVVTDWLAVPITSYGRSSLAPAEGLLTIGDAAAFIDAFTGSGILLALESGKIAADAIVRHPATASFDDLAREYSAAYRRVFDRRLRVCSMLRRAAFIPFAAETLIRSLALSKTVTRRLAQATRPAANRV